MRKFLVLLFSILILGCETKNHEKIILTNEDYNLELIGYKTPNINFKKFKGEVIFLNFWGSWCPPCRAEMPSVQELYDLYGEKVKFVLISMEEPAQDYQNFLQEGNYTVPSYQASTVISATLKPISFPTTFIIDKKGGVALKRGTARDWNEPDVQKLLDSLINQK